jgi:hypothetical protein
MLSNIATSLGSYFLKVGEMLNALLKIPDQPGSIPQNSSPIIKTLKLAPIL